MSTDKGGSDLDVFNELKPQPSDSNPSLETKKTLMGLQAPEGGLPPVPGSSPSASRSIPPPPPSQRPRRSSAAAAPAPSGAFGASPFGVNPFAGNAPTGALSTGALSTRAGRDDERAEDTSPGIPPESPRFGAKETSNAGTKESASSLGLDSWVMTQPPSVSGRISILPA